MKYWKMKTLLMVAFVGLSRVNSRLTVTPSDVEVVNGTWVTLNCSTDSTSPIVWIKEDEGGFNNQTVFNGSSVAAEFNTSYYISKPNQGSFNLEFVATGKTTSVYRCENEGDSSSAKLDIIESPGQPKMSELRNDDYSHYNVHHDLRHDNRVIVVGENTVIKKERDDTAMIAGIVGAFVGLSCLASLCKCWCCR